MDLGILVLRVLVGLTVAAHGAQKLFGIFRGHGLSGTTQFVESLGFRPGRPYAYLLGVAEFAGGALLAMGLFTPVAVSAIIGIMTAAAVAVHARNGFFVSDGGFEYPFMLASVAAAIAFTGPGSYSLDRLLGLTVNGGAVALQAIGLGLLAGLAVTGLRNLRDKVRLGRRRTQ